MHCVYANIMFKIYKKQTLGTGAMVECCHTMSAMPKTEWCRERQTTPKLFSFFKKGFASAYMCGVRVCFCVYVCMYTCVYMCDVHVYVFVCICGYMHAYICVYVWCPKVDAGCLP